MAGKLDEKVAIVTGGSKGIGAEIARRLAADGAAVVVNYASDKAGAERAVSDIKGAGGRAIAVQANVAEEADIRRLFDEAKKAYGHVDTLVNNAGVYEFRPIEEVDAALFHRLFDINVLGVLLASREAVKRMGPKGGSIINISSVVARAAPAMTSVYSATKGAVDAITRSLSQELGPRAVRVNSVNPGMVDTEGYRSAGIHESKFRTQVLSQTPLGRIGQPDDIAPIVSFLASDDASWITGEAFFVSGGLR